MPIININNLARLVTANEVRGNAFSQGQFDQQLITSSLVKIAEISHLEKAISREFYEELVTQHDTSGTLSANNQDLMDDYLVLCLSWFVKFEVLNESMYKITSSGVVMNIDDFSTAVSPRQFDLMKQDVLRKANLFLQDMLDFMNDNLSLFPTYKKYAGNSSTHNDGTTNKNSGIIFY